MTSLDTDVFVLFEHHFSHTGVCANFFKNGRKSTHADLTSFIPVHKVVCNLNEEHTREHSTAFMLSQAVTLVLHFLVLERKRPSKIMMIFQQNCKDWLTLVKNICYRSQHGWPVSLLLIIVWLQWIFVT